MKNQKVKVGIYKNGSHIKVIAEHDLISQSYNHRVPAIYLADFTTTRDPRIELTEADKQSLISSVVRSLEDNNARFKAPSRAEADAYIKYNLGESWETIRPFSEI